MITAIGFVAAAAVGALVRAEAGRRWNRGQGLPVGTIAVNVVGSFLLGLLWNTSPPQLTVLGVAGLGTLTTFSSFARDVIALVELRKALLAAAYLMASCGLGIAAAAAGVALVG